MTGQEFLALLWGPAPSAHIALWRLRDKRTLCLQAPAGAPAFAGEPDVYLSVALVRERLPAHQRVTNKAACAIAAVSLDLDVNGTPNGRGGLKHGVAPDLDAARQLANSIATPTLIVDSGYGIQPWWLLDEPWLFTTVEHREQAAELLWQWAQAHKMQAAQAGWEVDSTFDLARLMRLPGTMNGKGAEPVPVTVEYCDEARRFTIAELSDLCAHVGPAPAPAAEINAAVMAGDASIDVDALLKADGRARKAWSATGVGDKSLSAADHCLCCRALEQGWTDGQLVALIAAHRADKQDASGKASRADYLARTIAKARAAVAESRSVAGCEPASDGPEGDDWRATDQCNGELLALLHGEDLRYCDALGWLCWDGKRWRRDETGEAARRVSIVARHIRESIAAATFAAATKEKRPMASAELEKLGKRQLAWGFQSEQQSRLDAALKNARSHARIAIHVSQLDRHPDLLNVRNGTLDLRTGELREHRREDLLTRIAGAKYLPDSPAPGWRAFMKQMQPDDSVRGYIQRRLGSSLSGRRLDHVLNLHLGGGANGKNTCLDPVQHALGDYAMQAAADLLVAKPHGLSAGDESALAQLAGRRLVICSELEEGATLNEPIVKKLTGDRTIAAKLMRQDRFEFELTATIEQLTNHKPRVRGISHAIWRRLHLTPWRVTISKAQEDPRLPDRLMEERDGILTWLVEGYAAYAERGLDPPAVVTKATEAYRAEEDPLAPWLSSRYVLDPGGECSGLHQSYHDWCKREGRHPVGNKRFSEGLESRGCWREDAKQGAIWHGIRDPHRNERFQESPANRQLVVDGGGRPPVELLRDARVETYRETSTTVHHHRSIPSEIESGNGPVDGAEAVLAIEALNGAVPVPDLGCGHADDGAWRLSPGHPWTCAACHPPARHDIERWKP